MTYQANKWMMNDLHRRIVAAAAQFNNYTLLLRPTRRHIFIKTYKLNITLPEFFQPCFAILCEKNDPDKKPCLVIETDSPPDGLRDLYEQHGILWVHIFQQDNKFALSCVHGGTELGVREQTGSLFKLLAAPLSWHERKVCFPQGSLVHSHSERILREAVQVLSPSFRIECHHQVPLSYVLGYKDDLSFDEKKLLLSEIDAVITQSYEADPDCTVILPVKLDIHDSHREPNVKRKDEAIKQLCAKYQVPLLTITPGNNETFEFSCPVLNIQNMFAEGQNASNWAGAIAPFLGAAIRWAGRGF